MKQQITESVLLARIRRRLSKDEQSLRSSRRPDLGPYYIVDIRTNSVVASGCDLSGLACELGISTSPIDPSRIPKDLPAVYRDKWKGWNDFLGIDPSTSEGLHNIEQDKRDQARLRKTFRRKP